MQADPKTLARIHWAVLPMACIMITFCYLDRSNVAYMQLQLQLPPPAGLSFSDTLYGNASGLFFVGYALCQIPSNLILARLGAPLWLTVIVCLWGASAMLMAGMRHASDFMLLRLLLGVFEAGTFPGIWYHMTLFYPKNDMTLPLAATKASVMVAQLLSSPVAALLISLDGAAGLRGWQWLCLVEGFATVVAGASLLCFLPLRPESIKALSTEELGWIKEHVSRPPSTADVVSGLRVAACTPALWRLSLVFGLKSAAAYCLIFWTPLVISDLLGTEGARNHMLAILLTAVPYVFAASNTMLIGWLSHKYDERKLHTAVPFAVGGVVLLTAPLLQGPQLAGLAFVMLVIALCSCNATAPLTASLLGSLPRQAQPGGLALWNSLANVGGYFGPAVFGWLKAYTGGTSTGMQVMGCLLLLGAALMMTFDEQRAFKRAYNKSRSPADSNSSRDGEMQRLVTTADSSHAHSVTERSTL